MTATIETCENCGRIIGRLETACVHAGHVVCKECKGKLEPEIDYESIPEARPVIVETQRRHEEYRALGLNSRGTAWAVAIIGLVLSPAIVGIPLFLWGAVADSMIAKHERETRRPVRPNPVKAGTVVAVFVFTLGVGGMALFAAYVFLWSN